MSLTIREKCRISKTSNAN